MWKPAERIRWRSDPGHLPDRAEIADSLLFSPLRHGRLSLRNRSWVPAMVPWRAQKKVPMLLVRWRGYRSASRLPGLTFTHKSADVRGDPGSAR